MLFLASSYAVFFSGVVAGYLAESRKGLSVITVLAVFAAALYAKAASMSGLEFGILAASFMAGAASSFLLNNLALDYKGRIIRAIRDKKDICEKLGRLKDELDARKNETDNRAFVLGQIYDVLKKMSGMLKTHEIAWAFASFITERFMFLRCDILVVSGESGADEVSSAYTVMKNGTAVKEQKGEQLERWMPRILHYVKSPDFKPDVGRADRLAEELELLDMSSVARIIPLISEKSIVAVCVIRDLAPAEKDVFFTLVSQLGMEFKKAHLYETVERLSLTDSLTGMYLRKHFMDRAAGEIERAKRLKLECTVLMLDIDKFKKLNDQHGHLVGDVVLKDVARSIKENVREIDFVARYGGEEFIVLLPDTGQEGALHVAERIRAAIEAGIINAYDEKIRATISIGVALFPGQSDELGDLVNKADNALYASKKNGRNRVTLYA